MNQKEKLNLILKDLYENPTSNNVHSIIDILKRIGLNFSHVEAITLTERLESEGFLEIISPNGEILVSLTSKGIEYCEGDSFNARELPVTMNNFNISIENSPNANIVNASQNVSINSKINEIMEIVKKIEDTVKNDMTIEQSKKQQIIECASEIKSNLGTGKIPKYSIKSIISLIGSLSSLGNFALALSKLIL